MDETEFDVLPHRDVPAANRTEFHSTNSPERVAGGVNRRTDVVGVFPHDEATYRLVGAILMEQHDKQAV